MPSIFPDCYFSLHSFNPHLSSSDWYKLCIKWKSLHRHGFYWLLCLFTLQSSVFKKAQLSCFSLSHTPQGRGGKKCVENSYECKTAEEKERKREGNERESDEWMREGWQRENVKSEVEQPQHPHMQYTCTHACTHTRTLSLFLYDGAQQSICSCCL